MRRIASFFALSFVLAALVLVPLSWVLYQRFLDSPIEFDEPHLLFKVPPKSNLHAVSKELGQAGYLDYPRLLVLHARWQKQAHIQAGDYQFPSGVTPRQLLAQLNEGDVVQYSITLVEGKRFRELLQTLHDDPRIQSVLIEKSDQEIITALDIDVDALEGWFYPDTYQFVRGTTDRDILLIAFNRTKTVLAEEWSARAEKLPFDSPYEALILASIVEKETAVAQERPAIAGVFVRRLQVGMRLQTDPTVIYGLGDSYDGNLTRAHLAAVTPYNTYRINGLPPTPIAAASRPAIHAVLHPEDHEALFFVAKGDGTHQFSATLEEHNAAVRHYQIEKRSRSYRSTPAP